MKEVLVEMLQLGDSAAFNGIKMTSARSLKTIVIEILSRVAADDVMLECLE